MLCKCCKQELPKEPEVELPVLVGNTTRKHGYIGFKTIEAGASVYRFQNYLYIEVIAEKDNSTQKIKYHLDALTYL